MYPSYQFPYGTTNGTTPKYVGTAPYYYRIQTAQYCLPDGTRLQERFGDHAAHTLQAVEYCIDSELTNCAVGAAVTAAHVFSGVRWCNNFNLLEDPVSASPRVNYCQRKKIGNFVHAKHVGKTASQTVVLAPAVQNTGQITVDTVNASGGTVSSLTIGGVSVISGAVPDCRRQLARGRRVGDRVADQCAHFCARLHGEHLW